MPQAVERLSERVSSLKCGIFTVWDAPMKSCTASGAPELSLPKTSPSPSS